MRFSGQSIAITGGAGELGLRLVHRFVSEGAAVTIYDRQPPPPNTPVFYTPCDLASLSGIEAAASLMEAAPHDILINLAGVQHFGPFEAQSPQHLQATYVVNLLAPARLAQAALPAMRAKGRGQIVNIGSIFGSINFAHFATYSSSKAGLRGLSQACDGELAGSGVAVTYIAPRAVKTAFNSAKVVQFSALTKSAMDDPVADQILARRPPTSTPAFPIPLRPGSTRSLPA